MDKLDRLRSLNKNFLTDRPQMLESNSDPENLSRLLLTEARELLESIAGGDIKNIAQELADVGFFVLSLELALGIDIFDEMREKSAYNALRYQARYYGGQETNEEIRSKVKRLEIEENQREEFYSEF